MGLGGRFAKDLRHFTERYPTVSHGLSLSLDGPGPLDCAIIEHLGRFLDEQLVVCFGEHLSYCSAGGRRVAGGRRGGDLLWWRRAYSPEQCPALLYYTLPRTDIAGAAAA